MKPIEQLGKTNENEARNAHLDWRLIYSARRNDLRRRAQEYRDLKKRFREKQ